MSTASSFKVRFTVASDGRFAALARAYEHIRKCKAADTWPEVEEAWTPYFDSSALDHFGRPIGDESDSRWDFMSLFDAFKNGDYVLHTLERVSQVEAALPFDPFGHPYGGTDCMRALIEAFGHRVTEESP